MKYFCNASLAKKSFYIIRGSTPPYFVHYIHLDAPFRFGDPVCANHDKRSRRSVTYNSVIPFAKCAYIKCVK